METPPWCRQDGFDGRLEWGPIGVAALAVPVVVVVDVLRFSTAVEAAASRGAKVYPYRWKDDSAATFARSVGAVLATSDPTGPSLSPLGLLRLRGGDAVVLPSPNGSTCATIAAEAGATVVAGCLRNAAAIGRFLQRIDGPVGVVPCGERWPDGSLRPSVEDYLGAGAILSRLGGTPSPEAQAAVAAWEQAAPRIDDVLLQSSSGRELEEKGLLDDVRYAAEAGTSEVVPVLTDGAFLAAPDAT